MAALDLRSPTKRAYNDQDLASSMDGVDNAEDKKLSDRMSTSKQYVSIPEILSSRRGHSSFSQAHPQLYRSLHTRHEKLYTQQTPQRTITDSECSSSDKFSPTADFSNSSQSPHPPRTPERVFARSDLERIHVIVDSLKQQPELRKCQKTDTSLHPHLHGMCKKSKLTKDGDISSEEDRSEVDKKRFLNDTLHHHLKTFVDRICCPALANCLQVLKDFDLDLDYVTRLRDSGVCMKSFGEILDKCIRKAVISMDDLDNGYISGDAIGSESEEVQSTRHRKVPKLVHSAQQMSFKLPPNIPEQQDIFLQRVKQEPFEYHPFHQTETEKQESGSDMNPGFAEDLKPHVMTALSNKNLDYTRIPDAADKQPRRRGELANFSQVTGGEERTTDQSVNSSPEISLLHEAEPEPAMDTCETVASENVSRPTSSDGSSAVEDPDQLMKDRELEPTSRVPEDEDTVEMTQGGVTLSLLRSSIWRTFSEVGTEMIINRSGRRMFPFVSIRLRGLDEQRLYEVKMEVVPADSCRYKFIHNTWTAVGVADSPTYNHPYTHPESPNSGHHWMSREFHFTRIKLTNNKESSEGNMLLQSMHKYLVKITVKELSDNYPFKMARNFCFRLNLTSFIAVTAYQNDLVTKLKIHNNPFAKAFRDSSMPVSFSRRMSHRGESDSKTSWGDFPVARDLRHDPLAQAMAAAHLPATVGSLLDGPTALATAKMTPYYPPSTQTDEHRMVLPPPFSTLWVPGMASPWVRMGQGAIHPSFYNLQRPDGSGTWDPSKPF